MSRLSLGKDKRQIAKNEDITSPFNANVQPTFQFTQSQRTRGATTFSKLGGPIPWFRVLLPLYRKKLDRSTQFGAVGYIITLYSPESCVKSWGFRPNFGEVRTSPRLPQWLTHAEYQRKIIALVTLLLLQLKQNHKYNTVKQYSEIMP